MPRFFGIQFYQVRNSGWSEVYPINAASYTAAFTILDQMNGLRLAMATPDVTVVGNRISDSDVLRDSYVQANTTNAGLYVSGGATTSADADDTDRTLTLAGQLKRAMRHIHALPGILFVNGVFTEVTAWTNAYNAWAAALITNISIASKIRGAVAPPFYTFASITATVDRGTGNRKVGRPFGQPRGRRSIV